MLTFPLNKEEFKKIKSGEKTIKYLEVKPYWDNRLNKEFDSHCLPLHRYGLVWDANRTGTLHCCELRLGCANRYIAATITRIEIIDGQDTDLHIDKPVYAIHFANVIEVLENNMTREEIKEKTSLWFLNNPNNSEKEKEYVIEKVMATRATIVSKAALCNIITYLINQNATLKKQLEKGENKK